MSDADPPPEEPARPIPPPPRRRIVRARRRDSWPRPLTQMRADLDVDVEKPSAPYQKARLFQAVDNTKAAAEITRANAIATLAYDAIRAAVDVHLNASGLQIAGNDRHQVAVEYAHTAMNDLVDGPDLEVYDELRRVRNRTVEYPPIGNFQPPAITDADRYLGCATRMVGAVQRWLEQTTPS